METETEKEIIRRLANMERHIINLIIPLQAINQLDSLLNKPLMVDDRSFVEHIKEFRSSMKELHIVSESLNIKQTLDEIKYIGKRLNEIEKILSEFNDKGLKKNIHLDLTLDGYEMVRKPINYDETDAIKPKQDDELDKVLKTLTSKEQMAIRYRLGIGVKKDKNYRELGLTLKTSGERASQLYNRALRKLRHASRIEAIRRCNHKELRIQVTGD